ncbi:MAG: VWA domain-containing protein, partial [Chloroflexi bacterium]|nr:VWA domain-containing protein [Chloroflexota bacterium]
MAVGDVGGRRLALIGFALEKSDLPLQVAFPLLMSNLTEFLLPPVEGILPSSMRLGESLSVNVDSRIERALVTTTASAGLPGDGGGELAVSVAGGQLTIPGAESVGLRQVRAVSEEPEFDGLLLGETAVNLFSPDESDVAPGDPRRITEMGRVGSTDGRAEQPTRAEWWWPLAIAALALLALEWVLPRARRIGSLVIRLTLVACLVLSLAGVRLALAADRLSVVFLLDASASMLDATREELVAWARGAVGEMPEGDTAGVVVFGGNALVDRLPSELDELADPASEPVVGATDVGAAVRLAAAVFPAGAQQRIVLLSDGNDTAGEAGEAIAAAAARGIRLDVVTPTDESAAEVLVDAVDAPPGARVGETIDLTVRLRSTITTSATLRLLADGATIATRDLDLEPGVTTIPFAVTAEAPGFHVFRAVIEPDEDRFAQNNAADAYVLVTGEPQVLVATDDTERAADLVASLGEGSLRVTVVPADGVPSSLTTLAGYDSVVLDNVSAADLGDTAMASLQVYVRDLGRGLVMIGGRESYGAGGFTATPIEETLPVYMTVRDRERSPDVAMVAVVDKSGSMADCHCTGDARDQANPSGQRGFEKIDIAKEAILRAAEALAPTDMLGVVTFDQNAHWAVRTAPIDFGALEAGMGFPADGNTNIYAGLKAAYDDLVSNPATLRHIILITDGWSQSGAYDELLEDMQTAGITLSTIGTGGGSARMLQDLAEDSGGRYY